MSGAPKSYEKPELLKLGNIVNITAWNSGWTCSGFGGGDDDDDRRRRRHGGGHGRGDD